MGSVPVLKPREVAALLVQFGFVEVRHRIIPGEESERRGYVRVVDESGEDYGYSADRLFSIDVPNPQTLKRMVITSPSVTR